MMTVGMKVEAYRGRCIGVMIESTTWIGEVVKVNKKSIRVKITESVSMFGSKVKSRREGLANEVTFTLSKVLDDGRIIYRSESDLYGKIIIAA